MLGNSRRVIGRGERFNVQQEGDLKKRYGGYHKHISPGLNYPLPLKKIVPFAEEVKLSIDF